MYLPHCASFDPNFSAGHTIIKKNRMELTINKYMYVHIYMYVCFPFD